MAYPTIDAPYGLVPVGLIGGRSFAGASRSMKIASNYGTAIGKGSIVASDIEAFVVEDPDIILKAAICSSGTTMATLGRTVIGNKASIISNTLNTANGRSKLAINNSVATTSTLPFQIIDVVDSTATGTDTFQEVLVIYSAHTDNGSNVFIGGHAYRNPVGL